MADLVVDFSGVGITYTGLNETLVAATHEHWGNFVSGPVADPLLDVRIDYQNRSVPPGPFRPHEMTAEFTADAARFELKEGRVAVRHDGTAHVELTQGLGEREFWTLVNLVRASLAWRLLDHEGLMVHAACLVVDERAYLLVGPGGSGKSSWTRFGEEAGCRVVSDDLVLIDGSSGTFEVLGSPYRSTHKANYAPGRWPVAAALLPRWGSPPSWTPTLPMLAQARLTANLPFVAEGIESDPRVLAMVQRLTSEVPWLDLTFGLDPGFVELLRRGP